MKNLLYLTGALLLLAGCDINGSNSADQTLIVSDSDFASALENPSPFINDYVLEGDVLTLTYCDGGCDGTTWIVNLYASEVIYETNPPQRDIVLDIINEELCMAIPCRTTAFDISPLQDDNYDNIVLNIMNGEGAQISYEY